jgi:hypothetical protein
LFSKKPQDDDLVSAKKQKNVAFPKEKEKNIVHWNK